MRDFRSAFFIIGILLCIESIAMLIPMGIDLLYNNSDWRIFFFSSLTTFFIGLVLFFSFKQQKKNNQQNQQVIEYNEPKPSNRGTAMNYSEIEDTSINDFSSDPDSNLNFTDYKQAHSNNNLIDIDKIKVKEYKNVDDLENERSNISYKMTPEQLEKYNIQLKHKELDEDRRLQNVRRQDDQYEQHFNKMNKLLINSFHS